MTEPLNIIVPSNVFHYLGTLASGKYSSISPFGREGADVSVSDKDKKILLEKKIITPDGALNDKIKQTFQRLSRPTSYTWLWFGGRLPFLSLMTYFDKKAAVSVSDTGDWMRIDDPAPIDDTLGNLTNYIGLSGFSHLNIDLTLTYQEALLLVSIVDLRREQILGAILDRNPEEPESFPVSSLSKRLSRNEAGPQWLFPRLATFLDYAGPLSSEDITAGLHGLAEKGIVKRKDNSYLPGDTVEIMARRLVVLDKYLALSAGRIMKDGQVHRIGFEVTVSGFTDLLLWEVTNTNTVHLAGINSHLLFYMVSNFLQNGDALAILEEKPGTVIESSRKAVCSGCGAEITPDAAFCSKCGKPVEKEKTPVEKVCAECGRKVPPGAKFCDGCGKAIT